MSDESEIPAVRFYTVARGDDVIVYGRRVPLLEAHRTRTYGRTLLVFDRRIACAVPTGELDRFTAFVADVIEQCLNYRPHFAVVHDIDACEKGEDDNAE